MFRNILNWCRSKAAVTRRLGELELQLKLSREENTWLREQNEGYRNAFHSMETQHLAVGATAKAHIRALEEKKE